MGRVACCDQVGLKKGPWTPDEDAKLVAYIQRRGHGSWRALPKRAGMSSSYSSTAESAPRTLLSKDSFLCMEISVRGDFGQTRFPCWYLSVFPWDSTEVQYTLCIPLKWSAICLKSWTLNRFFLKLNWFLCNWRSDVPVFRRRSWYD